VRYHLDTSFLIDWRASDPGTESLCQEILAGNHTVTVDPIVQTEFLAAPRLDRTYEFVFDTVLSLGNRIELTSEMSRLAATWLAPMDRPQRRARFADALVAAAAHVERAILVTSDTGMPVFPVTILLY
jgi:predicted nucleic acid-binding protein